MINIGEEDAYEQLSLRNESLLVSSDRKKRSDATSEDIVQLIIRWWDEQTRVTANKRNVMKRNGVSHPVQWLEETVNNFYHRLLRSNDLFYKVRSML